MHLPVKKIKVSILIVGILCMLLCSCSNLSSSSGEEAFLTIDEIEVPTAHKEIVLPEKEETATLYPKVYRMDLSLDIEKHVLSGDVEVDLINQTEDTFDEIYVRNYPASILKEQGGNSEVSDFRLHNSNMQLLHKIKEDPSVIVIELGEEAIHPAENVILSFHFETEIPKQKDKFGYWKAEQLNVYQLSFCFPVIAMYEDGKWNESPYVETGESNYQKVSDYEVSIELPKRYEIASVGEESREGNLVKIKADKVREFAMVISDTMTVETEEVDGIHLNYYAFDVEGTTEYNKLSRIAMRDAIQLFVKYFGEYPYKELDVVQVYYHSAMEYSGLIMLGLPDVKSIHEIDDTGMCAPVASIAHEISHQWFYGLVGNNPYTEPWLDEAFAEYCEEVLYQNSHMESIALAADGSNDGLFGKTSEKEFHDDMKINAEQSICASDSSKGINQPCNAYDEENLEYIEYVYDGGYIFLYELSQIMTDGVFYDMLANYVETHRFKEVTTEDFLNAVRLYDNSDEVNKIIDKYIK